MSQPTPKVYRWADTLSGVLLLFLVVFAPWAFGTTERWSAWTLNIGGYLLGALLALKWMVRRATGFEPARWKSGAEGRWPLIALAGTSGCVLLYVLITGLNARMILEYTGSPGAKAATGLSMTYLEPVEWLPQSYDGPRTLLAFWKYLGMAASFWAARDWLLGLSRKERRAGEGAEVVFPPDRISQLLWFLVISTAVLSLVGILQRLDGTNKLLWLFDSQNPSIVNFGPFPYRGHASEYLNLIWPVALGFWWAKRERFIRTRGAAARAGGGSHILLLPLAAVIAMGTFLTASRGGVLIEAGLIPCCVLVLFFAHRSGKAVRIGLVVAMAIMVGIGWQLGGATLGSRFKNASDDHLGGREQIYEVAARMEKDYRVWGSGAETFTRLYFLYRESPEQRWDAYAHDDYLETRVTFGLVGFAFILASLVLVPLASQFCPGIPVSREFLLLLFIGMGGMLLHARFDFPFQSHCLHFVFLMLCALLSCLSSPRRAH
jgi:O-antigen ligase